MTARALSHEIGVGKCRTVSHTDSVHSGHTTRATVDSIKSHQYRPLSPLTHLPMSHPSFAARATGIDSISLRGALYHTVLYCRLSSWPTFHMRLPSLTVLVVLLSLLLGSFLHLDRVPPTFDRRQLQDIIDRIAAQHAFSPLTVNQTITLVQHQLHTVHPALIHVHDQWLFNLAGGFKTGLLLLHASLTEYVAIWGSAVHTVGHSGRNWATFDDWIIAGNGTWWAEGSLNVSHHVPFSHLHTERWAGRVVQLRANTWMLEHAHGVIPALLPFGLADGLVSSLDPLLIWKSLRQYGWMTVHSLLQGKV